MKLLATTLVLLTLMPVTAFSAKNIDKTLESQRTPLRHLAEQGDAEAQYQLGKTYCCGYGRGYDTSLALSWWCRAAQRGYAPAQFEIGQFYGRRAQQRPLSQPNEAIYAYTWYSLAAANGHTMASHYQEALERDLSPGQLNLAQQWTRQPAQLACGE